MNIFNLSKSKLRKDLLNLYFLNLKKGYYLRELEKILGHSVANIRKELIRLEKDGLFTVEKKGNMTYYHLNKSFSLYKELKNIVEKTLGLKDILINALKNVSGIDMAFIYGSFAKEEEHGKSDIDLFIIGKFDENDLIPEVKNLERKLQREINYTFYTRKEYEMKKKEGNAFIRDVLGKPKIL